jgi:EAL domain-containing protein (putative c-di-GMP-specific phosphodiesterase class I)
VAVRLRNTMRPEDSAARLSEDEFAVIVENIMDQADLESVGARILHLFHEPFDIYGTPVRVSISIGIAMAGPRHTTAQRLLRDADFAMTRAKLDGGGCSRVFDIELELPFKKSLHHPERELRRVLDRKQYEVWYQPIYQLRSGELDGFESLLRLRRPDGSIDTFRYLLGVAEDTGLSITLGRETMDTVCRQLHAWAPGSARPLTLTLNLTERQFYHPEMLVQLKKALLANNVDPSQLLFEVGENTLNRDADAAAAILGRMAEFKVRIAIDNLARLPIDAIKLSPRLIANAAVKERAALVLQSLVDLSRQIGVQVIAQGIESSTQLDLLTGIGCELGQGHLFSYAIDPAHATTLAQAGRWALASGA